MRVNFLTDPSKYKHWKLNVSGERAELVLDVDENGGLHKGYELKLNSYDLGVDIELNDAVQRLRFEHPNVKVVILSRAKIGCFVLEQILKCWALPATHIKLIFANSQMKLVTQLKMRARIQGRLTLQPLRELVQVVATSLRLRQNI